MNRNLGTCLVIIYFGFFNLLGFFLMAWDKHRAIRKAWRIPERTLLSVAFFGGGVGALLGMYHFRHKTRHMKFVILLPVAAVLSICVFGILLYFSF